MRRVVYALPFLVFFALYLPGVVRRVRGAMRGEMWWLAARAWPFDPVAGRTRALIKRGVDPPSARDVAEAALVEVIVFLAVAVGVSVSASRDDPRRLSIMVGALFAVSAGARLLRGGGWAEDWKSAVYDPAVDLLALTGNASPRVVGFLVSVVQAALAGLAVYVGIAAP